MIDVGINDTVLLLIVPPSNKKNCVLWFAATNDCDEEAAVMSDEYEFLDECGADD